jgi:transglutaminase-like putative cysteine protease
LCVAESTLAILPKALTAWRRDSYDNVLAVASFADNAVDSLVIESNVEVELYDTMPLDFIVEDHALRYPFCDGPEERNALAPYLAPIYPDDRPFVDWLKSLRAFANARETFEVLAWINRRIHEDIAYRVREEEGVLRPGDSLRSAAGSCRDMAALFLESCRRLGIASRFVSGYVHGPATEAGGASMHAWAEVYVPGAGWKGFDPTNDAFVGPDHVPAAVHSNPEAIPPVSGSFTGPEQVAVEMSVDVQINQLAESP